MVKTIKILNIDEDCTDNGTGLRTTIYVAGCWHHCEGCHNPSSWNKNNGKDMTIVEIVDIIIDNSLSNVTISGGDSLTFQYENTVALVKHIKETTDKTIWLYTGYEFEYLLEHKQEVLPYIDVLIDGKFVKAKRDLCLLFKGSSNQRIIDVQQSLEKNEVVLWEEKY